MAGAGPATAVDSRTTEDIVTLDKVRTRLAWLWLGSTAVIIGIVVLQSLLNKFGADSQEAWGWLLPTVMPTLGMIISVLGYTALSAKQSGTVVRRSFFQIASALSVFYLVLVVLTILVQPFTTSTPIELMRMSNLWLGPIQGLVASSLGVLFVSKQKKNEL